MFNYLVFCGVMYGVVTAEPPVTIGNGIKPTNILGGPEQHASFNFIRPGLTQTAYSFNGPSSHQSFSSSIGNPLLAQKVFPNVASALSYRNPGLGYSTYTPISTAFASSPHLPGSIVTNTPTSAALPFNQLSLDQAISLAFLQRGQSNSYLNQLNPLFPLRQAQLHQLSAQGQAYLPFHQSQAAEQLQLQHQEQQQQQQQHHHHHHHLQQQQQQQLLQQYYQHQL